MTDNHATPELWCHEEDTYTDDGHALLDAAKDAIHKAIGPVMDAGADAAHVGAIIAEAAQSAVTEAWNRRQDHPWAL